jgi:hypothetical protein
LNLLFDYADNQLKPLERQLVDQHLQHCDDCNTELSSIWNMQSASNEWADQRVPLLNKGWGNKKQYFFEPSPWPKRIQWTSSFASVLVLTQARFSTIDGLTVDFASDFISHNELSLQLTNLQARNQMQLNSRVQKLTSQQVETNQLLLCTVLSASQQERREDLGNLLVLWEEELNSRTLSTEESLRFLISEQLQDRREIQDLNAAILSNNRNF